MVWGAISHQTHKKEKMDLALVLPRGWVSNSSTARALSCEWGTASSPYFLQMKKKLESIFYKLREQKILLFFFLFVCFSFQLKKTNWVEKGIS